MPRIITVDGTATERTRLTKSIVAALRELMKQKAPDAHSYDLVAYISLALAQIHTNVEKTVTAWEKKDYWLKADKFRMQWNWTEKASKDLYQALCEDDWGAIAVTSAAVAQKLSSVQVSEKNRLGTPWTGAWEKIKKE